VSELAVLETLPAIAGRELIGPSPTREQINEFQDFLAPYKQADLPPNHYFAEGQYVRRLDIPAEHYVVGKIHKHEHIVMLAKGKCRINTDRGMEYLTGPVVWTSPVGAKRALHTVTDCVFFTFHLNPDNLTDEAALEALLIEPEKELLA
jgi:hypothetical protein